VVQPQLHPALAEFRTELERLGFVVVCHGSYLCVRLPLAASVRIHLNGTQLHFEPRFAMFSRGTSLVVTPTMAILAVAGVASVATLPAIIVAAFAGSLTVLYDLARLVMTESTTTRLQLLWTTRPPPSDILIDASRPDPGLPATRTTPAALREGADVLAEGAPTSVSGSDRLRSGR
jgi:hypothetical protein